jgi:hypothetical protein
MPRKGTIPRVCRQCGREFFTIPALVRAGGGIYCSRSCRSSAPRMADPFRPCRHCGEVFRARRVTSRYCTETCQHASVRQAHANVGERILARLDCNGPVPAHRADLGPCWVWAGSLQKQGYGNIGVEGRTRLVHKTAFELAYGPVPDGLELDHLCRNRPCANPYHLEAVTRRVNALRGQAPMVVVHVTGICQKGHPFTPENTQVERSKSGIARRCRACLKNRRSRAS